MSEYDDLMNLSNAKLAEGDSLLQVSDSYKRSAEATLTKGHELRKQAENVMAEQAKAKEVEFIPGEWVQVQDHPERTWHLRTFESYIKGRAFPYEVYEGTEWKQCRLPENVPGIFIRYLGNECPVSDGGAKIIVLLENRDLVGGTAEFFNWNSGFSGGGRIIGYVIIPKWALERVK